MVHNQIGCFRASLSRFKWTVRSIGINLWTLDVKRGSAGIKGMPQKLVQPMKWRELAFLSNYQAGAEITIRHPPEYY